MLTFKCIVGIARQRMGLPKEESMKSKVEPLRRKVMTLEQLQNRTLKVLKLTIKQFGKGPHEDGMSDNEFIHDVLEELDMDIRHDQDILKLQAESKQ
jgi:hypothetical protein